MHQLLICESKNVQRLALCKCVKIESPHVMNSFLSVLCSSNKCHIPEVSFKQGPSAIFSQKIKPKLKAFRLKKNNKTLTNIHNKNCNKMFSSSSTSIGCNKIEDFMSFLQMNSSLWSYD